MKLFTTLLAVLISVTALAQTPPPVSLKGQSGTKLLPKWNIQVPNNQATNLGGIDALIETGNNNLLANPGFEGASIVNCGTYDDGATPVPIDGQGGSPTIVTLGTQASTLGYGAKEGLITKASGDGQGEGVYCTFSAPAGKVIRVSGAYSSSANYADYPGSTPESDVGIYIYDDSNSALIYPAIADISASSNGDFSKTFQLTSAPGNAPAVYNFRVLFHTQTVNASAWTLLLDNLFAGERAVSKGAVDVEIGVLTPTLTSSGGGAITLNATLKTDPTMYCYRRSSHLNCTYAFRNGTGGAASGSAGAIQLNLPSGYTIDSSKLAAVTLSPASGACRSISLASNGPCAISVNDMGTALVFTKEGGTSASVSDLAASVGFTGSFSVPISGWSSNMTLSSEGGTRKIEFKAYRGTNLSSGITPNASYSKITFDAVEYDSTSWFNTSSQRYEPKETGSYECKYGANFASSNVLANGYFISLHKNGSAVKGGSGNRVTPVATTQFGSVGSTEVQITSPSDYLEVYIYGVGNNSSSTLTALADWTFFSCKKNSNPQTVGSVPTVVARYTSNSGQAIGTSETDLVFEDKEEDTTSGMSGSTYTFQYNGIYDVQCIFWTAAFTPGAASNTVNGRLYKNGSTLMTFASQRTGSTTSGSYGPGSISAKGHRFKQGDTVKCNGQSSVATTMSTFANEFSIVRIGD